MDYETRLRVLRRKDALEGLDKSERTELEKLRYKVGEALDWAISRDPVLRERHRPQRERFYGMVQEFLQGIARQS